MNVLDERPLRILSSGRIIRNMRLYELPPKTPRLRDIGCGTPISETGVNVHIQLRIRADGVDLLPRPFDTQFASKIAYGLMTPSVNWPYWF